MGDRIENPYEVLEGILAGVVNPRDLALALLQDITEHFSEERKIGEGAFGTVYKGLLHTGEMVAVKKILRASPSSQTQFENEVNLLMKLKHQNIVRLAGYCYETRHLHMNHKGKFVFAEDTESFLCLECLPNGSLDKYISDASSGLNWHTRCKIIEGISYGLQYLHEYSNEPIIHLDLKPANILLDENMGPKITDFGLSRLFAQNQTIHTIHVSGTLGYMSQEVLRGVITPMADIFSLGVIIMELITGHKDYPYDIKRCSNGFTELELQKWKSRLQKEPGYTSLETDCQQIERCIQIGLICVNPEPTRRPTIKKIIDMLEGIESMNWYISNEAEHAPNEQHHGMPNSPGETSPKMVECRSEILEESQSEIQLKQVQVCAEVGIECIDFSPANRPDTQHIIDRLGETENMDDYTETDLITTHQVVQKDLVFTVSYGQGYKLNQLRDLNNLHGSLVINDLNNVTSMEGLNKLKISCYQGSRYPDWMVGKQNGGPKDLQEFDLHTFAKGPAPQIVEATGMPYQAIWSTSLHSRG